MYYIKACMKAMNGINCPRAVKAQSFNFFNFLFYLSLFPFIILMFFLSNFILTTGPTLAPIRQAIYILQNANYDERKSLIQLIKGSVDNECVCIIINALSY